MTARVGGGKETGERHLFTRVICRKSKADSDADDMQNRIMQIKGLSCCWLVVGRLDSLTHSLTEGRRSRGELVASVIL